MRTFTIMVLLIPSGCSFFMATAPSPGMQKKQYEYRAGACNDSVVLPVLDTIGAGFWILGAEANTSQEDDPYTAEDEEEIGEQAVALGVALAVVQGAAAIYGYINASKCKDAKREVGYARAAAPPARRRPLPPFVSALPPPQ